MKKLINISLVIVLLMTTNFSFSGEVVTASNQKNNTNTKIKFEIVKKGSVLSIQDENGQVIDENPAQISEQLIDEKKLHPSVCIGSRCGVLLLALSTSPGN